MLTPSKQQSTPLPSISKVPPHAKKQKMKDSQPGIIKDVSVAMTKLTEAITTRKTEKKDTSSHHAFAQFVESKMLQIHESIADNVQEEILKILFNGIKTSKEINNKCNI